ncbi:MAG: SDR family NAD(P)-dependent oxidoreductase [Clostridiales bacterium]|jgi:NAD(P)-dependent dehydrogenase (short-subunit alcohol dehydrogenase family)|nr:SDR family NAD(P)-dependent oxidoreductase [Clostridiales bacterium]
MKDFAGKVAFITGGASGAGFGQAQIFSEAGMKVVIADIREDHLENAAAYFKDKDAQVHFIKLDVMDRKGWAEAADETERVFGTTPDLFIQTAGVNAFGPIEASTFEDFDWVVGVNFGGVVNGLVTFVPRMMKAGKGGHIVTTVSLGALGANPGVGPYTAAKAATLNLMESYYLALKPYGIAVSALLPGNIRSNINDAVLKTRPEHLKNTGYHATEESQEYAYAVMQAHGIDPRILAERLKKGIEDEIFLIVPYPSGTRMVERALSRLPLYTTVGGMRELEERGKQPPTEEDKKLFLESENYEMGSIKLPKTRQEAGFGMARNDLDWVDETKRMKMK